ncbi:hypothetical protein [Entomobacter blattae]|uniref:hypothetical protein n=1 Tax=Entomobacter blattae TaxID=2762277 RepID=UPI00193B753F|nr:hypothetical protein [Entomobacter blattae]
MVTHKNNFIDNGFFPFINLVNQINAVMGKLNNLGRNPYGIKSMYSVGMKKA